MTRNIIATCGALALAGLAVSAQAPRPPQSQSSMSGETVTITGCLNEWDQTLGMKRTDVASPQTASAPRQFILTDSKGDNGGTTYMLETPGGAANLRGHINHTVEITGTARPADSGGADTDSPSMSLSILTVQNVKMVSASCSK